MGMASSEPNVLFTNKGEKFLREMNSGLEETIDSRAILVADFDNDGRQDLFVTNNDAQSLLFRNQYESRNHWLEVELEGTSPNTDAIGARIYVTAGGVTMMREVNAGNGFGGGSMLRQHFGLGQHAVIEKLLVRWPNGDTHSYKAIDTNRIIRLSQSKKGITVGWNNVKRTKSKDI